MAARRHRTGSHHRPAPIVTPPWWMEAGEPSCFEREQVPSASGGSSASKSESKLSTLGAGWATPSSPKAQKCMEMIRALVESGHYEFGAHVQSHMIEEGFDKEHCVGAVLGGRVLEVYVPPQQRRAHERFLVAGRFHISARNTCPLHIVCEFFEAPVPQLKLSLQAALKPVQSGSQRSSQASEMEEKVRFVTAYIPRPPEWISPHVRAPRP